MLLTIRSFFCRSSISLALGFTVLTSACSNGEDLAATYDDGSMAFPDDTRAAIQEACDLEVPSGIKTDKITAQECYLFIAGATNKESSWDLNKPAEAWGQPDNPARGLTQSRDSDARFVGLPECAGKLESDSVCNVRVGLRNIITRADTLDAGVSVHLGAGNAGAKNDYMATIEKVWNREDVRKAFGITGKVRNFADVRYLNLRGASNQQDFK